MYIRSAEIRNIRLFSDLKWSIPAENAAGWHVILGDNGAGKSCFVCALALALIGPSEAHALRETWNDWLRREENEGHVRLDLIRDDDYDALVGPGRTTKGRLPVAVKLNRLNGSGRERSTFDEVSLTELKEKRPPNPDRHVWGGGKGWFSSAYGPLRRFSGSDPELDRIYSSDPKLARHLSAFREGFALAESLNWLEKLQYKKLEEQNKRLGERRDGKFLDAVITFINQKGFLPYGARLETISSDGVEFLDGNGCQVWIEDMSDGYRSVLSMTLELIRQIAIVYGSESVFDPNDPSRILPPGVVLIDEVDVHLHPTWQRQIGLWFRQHFPNMQFIVTTHSPLVCQAANVGTVYRLPNPGTAETGGMITGVELERLLYGDILEAYSTEAFGSSATRSEEGQRRLDRLKELNYKEIMSDLSTLERKEQEQLRANFPTAAHSMNAASLKE